MAASTSSAAVEPHQAQQPPQVDRRLDRHREQLPVELAGFRPQGVELLLALAGLATPTQSSRPPGDGRDGRATWPFS